MMLTTQTILKRMLLLCTFCTLLATTAIAGKPVIVGFHQKPDKAEKKLIQSLGGTIKRTYSLLPAIAADMPQESIAILLKNPSVTFVEDDVTVHSIDPSPSTTSKVSSTKPLSIQSLASDGEYDNSWGVERIGAKVAHDKNITGSGIKIAILDTGINYNHEDLDANYRGGYNFITNGRGSDDPFDDSYNQHGTNIAGIIAAESNDIGVVGVAPDASIYAVKVLDGSTFGSLSDIIAGIQWAVENNMDIANISIAGVDSSLLQATCDAAEQAGLLIVASAGNTYSGAAQFPAAYDSVVAVAGTDQNDSKGFFSPIDPVLEIAAPGLNIYSTAQENSYAALSGTSQSAAFVSGAAALLLSKGINDRNNDGIINNDDLRKTLQTSVTDLGILGRDDTFGYGLLNIRDAFNTTEDIVLNLKKESALLNGIQEVLLEDSAYRISMKNSGLTAVVILVYSENRFRGDLTKFYFFKEDNETITISLDGSTDALKLFFMPLGNSGNTAQITLTKL